MDGFLQQLLSGLVFGLKFFVGASVWMICMAGTGFLGKWIFRLVRRYGIPALRWAMKSELVLMAFVILVGINAFYMFAWPALIWLSATLGLDKF